MSKKSILLIVLLAVVLNVFYNSNFIEVRSHEKYSNELGELLSQKYFSNKIIGKQYTVSQIIQTNDPLFKILKEKGEEFLCGINAVYSLNNDENAEVLNIKCYNLAGHMTLAFIST